MDYSQAREIIRKRFPNSVVVHLSESELCWSFTLAESLEKYIPNVPGNVPYVVDKQTGEVFPLFVDSEAFWKYLPDLEKVPIPEE